jgi:ATP-dependent DNA helicase RecG
MSLPLQKLLKFLDLEIKRGYDNKAVVGGLEKILPVWKREAQSHLINPGFVNLVESKLKEYRDLDEAGRADQIRELSILVNEQMQSASERSGASQDPQTGHDSEKNDPARYSTPTHIITNDLSKPRESENGSLDAPLTVVPGIGKSTAGKLNNLDLATLNDLLYHFPRRYDDYSQLKPINRLSYAEELTVIGTLKSVASRQTRNKRMTITEAVLSDGTGFLRLIWFNQPYIEKVLTPEMQIVVSGKIDLYLGRMVINNPEWERLDKQQLHTNRIVPVYPLTSKLTQRWMRNIMHKTVTLWAPRIREFLPRNIRDEAGLVDLPTAISQIHFPDSTETLRTAKYRLSFDEIFLMQLGVLQQKREWQSTKARAFSVTDGWIDEQVQKLPFRLTSAQTRVIQEIRADLESGYPMNRLIQGDVGSGKTILAALAAGIVSITGSQSAFMAPTSILAEQHYHNLKRLLCGISSQDNGLFSREEIQLLVGSTPESEKNEILNRLSDGRIKILIGTHALIEEPVQFKDLQLAIVDEQHRFGVKQRAALRSKGTNPHLLVMTATPIPRSLALTVYGDLELSVLDEMPPGRKPVDTRVLHPIERERAYLLIDSQLQAGHQAFIVYPLIEEGENEETKAAVQEYERLQEEVFPTYQLGLLHGRMNSEEKDIVMNAFRNGDFDILVTTSVVEVGVDIPNANVMLVEGANRFGLAQLHQFRGRVGRDASQAFCLLIPETEDSLENERLSAMAQTNDGFVLAERDLEQRGPGEFLGTRQSGYTRLKLASIMDVYLIEKARKYASKLFEEDPDLSQPEHLPLIQEMKRFWSEEGKGDIS